MEQVSVAKSSLNPLEGVFTSQCELELNAPLGKLRTMTTYSADSEHMVRWRSWRALFYTILETGLFTIFVLITSENHSIDCMHLHPQRQRSLLVSHHVLVWLFHSLVEGPFSRVLPPIAIY